MDNFAGFDIGQDLRGALNLDGAAWALSALREGPMSRFVVRFMKDVLGGNGRAAEICQSSLEIDADCEGDAEELAKLKFCETQSLCHWSLHADRIQVKVTDFPS